MSGASTTLLGNGLQDGQLLAARYASVYTRPDETRNRSGLVSIAATHERDDGWSVSGQAYLRRIDTRTRQRRPERRLARPAAVRPQRSRPRRPRRRRDRRAAGRRRRRRRRFRISSASPRRCRAQTPSSRATACSTAAAAGSRRAASRCRRRARRRSASTTHQFVVGAAFDASRTHFAQSSQAGFLQPDRSVETVNDFLGGGAVGAARDDRRASTRAPARRACSPPTASASATTCTSPRRRATTARPSPTATHFSARPIRRRSTATIASPASIPPSASTGIRAARSRCTPATARAAARRPRSSSAAPTRRSRASCPTRWRAIRRSSRSSRAPSRPAFAASWRRRPPGARGCFARVNRDDLLFVSSDASGQGYFRNFGKTRRQGVELGAATRAGAWSADFAWTLLDARFMSSERVNGTGNSSNDEGPGLAGAIDVVAGDRLPLIPRQTFKASLAVAVERADDAGARPGGHVRRAGARQRERRLMPPTAFSIWARAARRVTLSSISAPPCRPPPRSPSSPASPTCSTAATRARRSSAPTGFDAAGRLRVAAVPRRCAGPLPAAQLDLLRRRRAAPVLARASLCVRLIPSPRPTPRRRADGARRLRAPPFFPPCTCGSSA